ncbi:phosphoethanolamine transferase [Litoreibacter ascidiaceicola]|nr:phosphoethanolamine--lipid A transferase [Litoreibacter ascidiaceicola]
MLTILTVAFVFCAYNATFWTIAVEIFAGHLFSLFGYISAVFFLTLAAFSFFGLPWLVKPFLIFVVILSSVSSYYTDNLGVIIDRDMIQNAMVTTVTESKHLITAGFVLHVLSLGVVPAVAILSVKIKPERTLWRFGAPVLTILLSLCLAAGFLMADLKSYSATLRERKDFMSAFQPGAPMVATIRYAKMMMRSSNVTVAAVGRDAKKGPSYNAGSKPVLTIVVAGETARAQNFSLNGYDVQTNPNLEQLPIVNFSNVSSCGTATATSLPCMFSKFSRDDYSYEKGVSNENVLDVLAHAGLQVDWWDNNTGDKGIARRVGGSRSFTQTQNDEFCASGECMDGIFMKALEEYSQTITRDTVLVLHLIGSHGPTYYLRYPKEFERFTPACSTAEFKNCSPVEITNAYDNTIAYTDQILAQTIALLTKEDRLATSLLFVSDHGESLGEKGLYLHGAPYFMAPEYQTKVPMILWMSNAFKAQFSIDQDCLSEQMSDPLSHDNLYHSLLGMLDIKTTDYEAKLDLFASCKDHQKIAQN